MDSSIDPSMDEVADIGRSLGDAPLGESEEDADAAAREFAEMQRAVRAAPAHGRVRDLWATPGMRRRTLVAVGVQVFGQFSGINGGCGFALYMTPPRSGRALTRTGQ